MVELHTLKMRVDGAGRGTVELDGRPMAAQSVRVDTSIDAVSTVTLTLLCADVDVEVGGGTLQFPPSLQCGMLGGLHWRAPGFTGPCEHVTGKE